MAAMAQMTKSRRILPTLKTGIIVYDGVHILDLAGPLQALTTASDELGKLRYDVEVVSLPGGDIRTGSGVALSTRRLNRRTQYDTIIIPGGPGIYAARQSKALVDAVRHLAQNARRQCTVCTGAFLLAETGLLDGRQVVTHWRSCRQLAADYPQLMVEEDPIHLQDGSYWTSAGVTAGIDLTLALIEADNGREIALKVARRLVVYMKRPGGQRQFSEPLVLQSTEGAKTYAGLLDEIAARPAARWRIEDMASVAGQSVRTFHRQFRRATRSTPAEAVERIRCERAQVLLQTTDLPIARVGSKAGFDSESSMRRALKRLYGFTPAQLRQVGLRAA